MNNHEFDDDGSADGPLPEDTESSLAESQGVAFLTDTQRAYLQDGTLDGETESELLDRLRKNFVETLWQTPCLDRFAREEMELIAHRLDIPSEEVSSLKPNEVFEQLDEMAVELRTLIDRLYHSTTDVSMDALRWIRREKLDYTQGEVAARLAEVGDLSQSSYVTRLSEWESGARSISEEDRDRLATVYRDLYKENHDPYQIRDDRDWTIHYDSDSDTESHGEQA